MARLELTEKQIDQFVADGSAQVLFRDAAEEEYGRRFMNVRSNQKVACVMKFFRKTQWGYKEITADEIKEVDG